MPHRSRDGVVPVLAEPLSRIHGEVLADYSIGSLRSCRSLQGGMFVRPLLVETDTGKYVLRGHTFRSCKESFLFQAQSLEQLSREGVRCPQVIHNRFGDLGRSDGSIFWALYNYLEGHLYPWTDWLSAKSATAFLEDVGSEIASIHGRLSTLRPEGDGALSATLPPIQFDFLDRIQIQWNLDMDFLRPTAAHPSPRSREALLENSEEVAEYWRFVNHEAISLGIARLPKQLVHGDVSPVNMVFEIASRRFALIDWDCLHYGLPLYDALGDVLNRPPLGLAQGFDFQIEEVQRYLKGYQEGIGRKISRHELSCVPILCAARQLEDLRQRFRVLPSLSTEEDEESAILIRGRIRTLSQILRLKDQFPKDL